MSEAIDPTELGGEIETHIPSDRELIYQKRDAELLGDGVESTPEPEKTIEKEKTIEPPQSVKVKIDGIEEEKSLEELVRHYQKSESGDRKLQQAAIEQQRLAEERRQLEEERLALQELARKPVTSEPDPDIEELKVKRREAMEFGDYEAFDQFDEAINNARLKKTQPSIDVDSITQNATQTVRQQMQYESAYISFANENKSLISDPTLYNLTMGTFNEMCKESNSYQEAFEKTGKAMKDWIGSVSPAKVDTAMTDRQAKKDTIQAEPGRVNARSTPPPAKKEETASDIIAEMRRSRGLPV